MVLRPAPECRKYQASAIGSMSFFGVKCQSTMRIARSLENNCRRVSVQRPDQVSLELRLAVVVGVCRPVTSLSGLRPSELACRTHTIPRHRAPAPKGRSWPSTGSGAASTFCARHRFEELFAFAKLRSNPTTRCLNDRRIGLIAPLLLSILNNSPPSHDLRIHRGSHRVHRDGAIT